MEPVTITTAILASIVWENFGQPVLDSVKSKYADKALNKLSCSLPFKQKENEIIETKIIEAVDNKVITNELTFIDFLENNDVFIQAIAELKKIKSTTEIINSFKSITESKIKISGDDKKVTDSFNNINNSQIYI